MTKNKYLLVTAKYSEYGAKVRSSQFEESLRSDESIAFGIRLLGFRHSFVVNSNVSSFIHVPMVGDN